MCDNASHRKSGITGLATTALIARAWLGMGKSLHCGKYRTHPPRVSVALAFEQGRAEVSLSGSKEARALFDAAGPLRLSCAYLSVKGAVKLT